MKNIYKILLMTTLLTLSHTEGAAADILSVGEERDVSVAAVAAQDLSRGSVISAEDNRLKEILGWQEAVYHPDATPGHIIRAAQKLKDLGSIETATQACQKVIAHPDAKPGDIIWVAGKLKEIGKVEEALRAYEIVSTHPHTDHLFMAWAADGLRELGHTAQAMQTYQKVITHPDATPGDIIRTANRLMEMGKRQESRTAYRKLIRRADATPSLIDWVMKELGSKGDPATYPRLAWHFETPAAILWTAKELSKGEKKVDSLYSKLAQHPNATPNDIISAAEGLRELGNTEEAMRAYQQAAAHPLATPSDILRAGHGLMWAEKLHEAVAIYRQILLHPLATEENKERARLAIIESDELIAEATSGV